MGKGIQKVFTTALVGIQICVVCLFTLWISETQSRLEVLETRSVELHEEKADLQRSIDIGRSHIQAMREDKLYLESVARAKLSMGEADEYLIKIRDPLPAVE